MPREGGGPHPLFGGRGLGFHSSRPAPSGAQRCPANLEDKGGCSLLSALGVGLGS